MFAKAFCSSYINNGKCTNNNCTFLHFDSIKDLPFYELKEKEIAPVDLNFRHGKSEQMTLQEFVAKDFTKKLIIPKEELSFYQQDQKNKNGACIFFWKGACTLGTKCPNSHTERKIGKAGVGKITEFKYDQNLDTTKKMDLESHFNMQYCLQKYQDITEQTARIYQDLARVKSLSTYQQYGNGETIDFQGRQLKCQANSLDLMFIIDCTGSMCSWIQACKDQIKSITDDVKKNPLIKEVRVCIIAYRDYERSGKQTHNQYEVFAFSQSINSAYLFLSQLVATGGDDGPEDVCGAFNLALKQNWCAQTRYVIYLSDAPCHGKKYHSMSDNFPAGDPAGLKIEEQMMEFGNRFIFFHAIEITSTTNTMFDIMNKCYKERSKRDIGFAKLGEKTMDLQVFIKTTLSSSISASHSSFKKSSSSSLLNKLISLTSESKIDVVEQVMKKINDKIKPKSSSSGFDVINSSSKLYSSSSQGFEVIPELDEDQIMEEMKIDKKIEQIDEDDEDDSEGEDEVMPLPQKKPIVKEEVVKDVIMMEEEVKQPEEEKKEEKKEENKSKNSKYKINFKLVTLSDSKKGKLYKMNAICHSFYIVKEKDQDINWRKPLVQASQIKRTVSVAKYPFSQGAMRYAFYMKEEESGESMVAKLPKNINPRQYNIENMKKDIEAMIICSHITNEFNERIVGHQDVKVLSEFVNSYIYEFTDADVKFKYAYGENFINGKYEKFNNNAGWISGGDSNKTEIAQALSHFSWQLTQGYLIIVDIQGVGNTYTDPQIHCLDKERFGKGNLGYYGILMFFNSHVCNSQCANLGLVNPKSMQKIPLDFQLFADFKAPDNMQSLIKRMCELCRKPYNIKYSDFLEKRIQSREFWCDHCTIQRNQSMKSAQCVECQSEYKCSAYYYEMKRSEFPDRCYPCRVNQRDKLRTELDGWVQVREKVQPVINKQKFKPKGFENQKYQRRPRTEQKKWERPRDRKPVSKKDEEEVVEVPKKKKIAIMMNSIDFPQLF